MALEQNPTRSLGALRGPYALMLYLAGLVALYIGERLIGGTGGARTVVSGLAALAILLGLVLWLAAWLRAEGPARAVERLMALLGLGGLLALVLYLSSSDLLLGPAPIAKADAGVTVRQVLQVAWPILLAVATLPLIFVQISVASMARGKGVEVNRAARSAHAGAVMALLLATLFLVNAVVNRKDVHVDLSYFKTTRPSDATRSLIQGLTFDTQAILFFAGNDETLEQIRPYFEALGKLNPRFTVKVVDPALEPELAKEHRAATLGTIALARGEAKEKIALGADLEKAKPMLRKFDAEFQTAMLKLNRSRDVVYLVTGHGERGTSSGPGDQRSPLAAIRKFLTMNNLIVKNLGAVEGLAREVPSDAAMVLWMEPQRPLLPGEYDALKAYLDKGGRLLLTLGPSAQGAEELLGYLGLKFSPAKLANARAYVPLTRSGADQYNLITNAFSSHPSVETVSKNAQLFPVLFPSTGALEKLPDTARRVVFTVRSLPETWADGDGDMQHGGNEPPAVFQLAAAVSEKIAPPASDPKAAKDDKADPAPAEDREMRVAVVANTDVFADAFIGLIRNNVTDVTGNLALAADLLRWLSSEAKIPGAPASEEDVKIAHTRSEDVAWFYGTVFAVPVLILGIGASTRWGRGRKRRIS